MSMSKRGKYPFRLTLPPFDTNNDKALRTCTCSVYKVAPPLSVEPPRKKKKSYGTKGKNKKNKNWSNAVATQDQCKYESPPKLSSKIILLSIPTFALLRGTKEHYRTHPSLREKTAMTNHHTSNRKQRISGYKWNATSQLHHRLHHAHGPEPTPYQE